MTGSKQVQVLKDPRDKVNYLRFSNYASNTLHKPKMSRIVLKVVLPVFLVLKLDYKCVGDTILSHKVSIWRDSTPFEFFFGGVCTIRSYLQAFRAVINPTNSRFHIRLVRCGMKALILQREHSRARLARGCQSNAYHSVVWQPNFLFLFFGSKAYSVNLLRSSI